MKISVVIPVYNGEKYLIPCLNSVLNQTFHDREAIETILVDDGSTDNTLNLAEQLAPKFWGRLRIVKLPKHTGLPGKVRNTGMRLARGKYIAFLDSDDLLMPDAMERLYKRAEAYNADIVHTEGWYIPQEAEMKEGDQIFLYRVDYGEPVQEPLLEGGITERVKGWIERRFYWMVWNKLYRRDFLMETGLQFPEMPFAEDQPFSFYGLLLAKRYLRVPDYTCIHRPNPKSITKTFSIWTLPTLVQSMVIGVEQLEKIMAEFTLFGEREELRFRVLDTFLHDMEHNAAPIYAKYGAATMERAFREALPKGTDRGTLLAWLFGEAVRCQLELFHKHNRSSN